MSHAKALVCLVTAIAGLASAADAAINVKQTYTNRTGAAAAGFRWWWTPDATTSGLSSSAFTAAQTTHYPNGLPFSPLMQSGLRIDYTSGNVNVGASATMYATFTNTTSIAALRAEWLNAQNVPIGSANLPCSIGGSYPVSLGGSLVWNLRIDNPSDQVLMLIDRVRFAVTSLRLSQQALTDFDGPWQVQTTNLQIPPGGVYDFAVTTADPSQLVVVDADLFDQATPEDVSNVRFQIVPEPVAFGAVALLSVLTRRPRR